VYIVSVCGGPGPRRGRLPGRPVAVRGLRRDLTDGERGCGDWRGPV